mmetsp:Transcript_31927/g.101443  ORF Transcript_31927/g.101443 Transcript_31927/m.101443 type:complete len:854 (-) Transcript_31927:1008-3569(-)
MGGAVDSAGGERHRGGSSATIRRARLRSRARCQRRGSTFWRGFQLALALLPRPLQFSTDDSSSFGDLQSGGSRGSASIRELEHWSELDLGGVGSTQHASPMVTEQPQAASLPCLLRTWVSTTLSSSTAFGSFARDFIEGRFPRAEGRHRDVLPLPVVKTDFLEDWHPAVGRDAGFLMLNLTCAGLNFLFLGGEVDSVPSTATSLQKGVIRRLTQKLDAAFYELGLLDRRPVIEGSFERLVGTATGCKFPTLRADDVDILEAAGTVDPMPWLPPEVQSLFVSPARLFPNGLRHLVSNKADKEAHHGDRVTLTIRLLRAGKLSLMRKAAASADTFMVGKKGGVRLRENWNGKELTEAALPSKKPPLQASPAALATLEASRDRPQWLSCRDGKVFFDQLAAPASLRPMFGRPNVCVAELLRPPPCESGASVAEGLTAEEVGGLLLDGPLGDDDVLLTPVSNTWPMGFGWSSFVAQTTMLTSCLPAGFGEDSFLSEERAILPGADVALAVATDDINHFMRMSAAEAEAVQVPPLQPLDAEWLQCGIRSQSEKSKDLVKDAKVLGVQLRGGTRLQSCGPKIWDILEASCDLARSRRASPLQLASLNGQLQWQNLMNRPLYSCLGQVYHFVRLEPEHQVRIVPDGVISEMLLNTALLAFWSADLCRPWWPMVPATDASPAYGFGLSVARCKPTLTRFIAAAAADGTCVIRLGQEEGDPIELPRAGQATVVNHSGAMELEAVKLALLRLTRVARNHAHRGVVLVDAQAVGFALRKGRTSAPTLKRGVGAVAAICLATDLMLSFPYLPSESNPADFPSRGKVRRRIVKKPRKRFQPTVTEKKFSCGRRSVRRLQATGMLAD